MPVDNKHEQRERWCNLAYGTPVTLGQRVTCPAQLNEQALKPNIPLIQYWLNAMRESSLETPIFDFTSRRMNFIWLQCASCEEFVVSVTNVYGVAPGGNT